MGSSGCRRRRPSSHLSCCRTPNPPRTIGLTPGIGGQCCKRKGASKATHKGALEEVSGSLVGGELLCAFLDDVYLLCEPERVRFLLDLLAEALTRHAGIQLHQGKTRVWNRNGEVWRSDGIKVLGAPLGSSEFVALQMEERLTEERRLREAIPHVQRR